VLAWLNAHAGDRTDIECSPPVTLILDEENEVEPGALLFRSDPSRIDADGYLIGAPELVVEVAASSRSRDLHQKKAAYERNGVAEYIVWRVVEGELDWFELRDGRYIERQPGHDGIIESTTFPGLRLDVPALLRLDRAAVLAALRD
jgi:Uma2 family endonuclease